MKKTSRSKLKLALLIIPVLLNSCLKESPVPVHKGSGNQTVQIAVGETYRNQVFYDLEQSKITEIKDKDAWDLALNCSDTSNHLILNSAKIMGAIFLADEDIHATISTSGVDWKYESSEGFYTHSALYDWHTKQGIFVVNAGMNYLGQHQGYYKIKPELLPNGVKILWVKNGQSTINEIILTKNEAYNYIGFSFLTNDLVEVEPDKSTWDLKFSVYTHVFEENTPYSVVGVLLNPNLVKGWKGTSQNYEAISLTTAESENLSGNLDVIGYDWKEYSFDQSLYVVNSTISYIVRSRNSYYFKMRFIDFYNEMGIKGYPTFEMESM